MIRVTINGEDLELPDPTPLPDYVASLHVNSRMIAIAYNGEVLRRDNWDAVILSDGDTVEVVRAVGGG
jgi:sulfur carrier protein